MKTMSKQQIKANAKIKYTTCMHDGFAMISPYESHQPRRLLLLTRIKALFVSLKRYVGL